MKTVVITGTSRGIGHALAEKFLVEKYRVIGTSTSGKNDIKNPQFEIVQLDLTNSVSIAEAAKKIGSKASQIDILINNAGVALEDDKTDMSVDLLRKSLEVNLIGLIDFTEKLLPVVSRGGQILNISSQMGSLAATLGSHPADNPAYRISKTALNMYTKTLAIRAKKREITVSSVHPGWVKTQMGGKGAPREPEEAADQLFKLATTKHPTSLFWYDNKTIPW